jgi:hypothetical protein
MHSFRHPARFGLFVLALGLTALGTRAGGRGSIKVTARTVGGRPVTGATIDVVSTTTSASTNTLGKATLSKVSSGSQTLRVRFIGCPVWTQTVNVPSSGSVSVTATLACKDVVSTNAPSSALIGVLDLGSDISGPARCLNDAVVEGIGSVTAPGNAGQTGAGGTSCHLAVLLLAQDRAPFYENNAAAIPWSAGYGDVYNVVMPAHRLRVPVAIFVSDPAVPFATLQNTIETVHLAKARLVFDDSYAGIELANSISGGAPPISEVTDEADRAMLDGGCLNAAAIRASALYDPERINVYYTKDVKDETGGLKAGYDCATSDAPNIIFVDSEQHLPFTLLHEIGHALGLTRPDWGHSQTYERFYSNSDGHNLNIMAETNDLPGYAQYLSVGQIAWMHLRDNSWLNRAIAGTSTIRSLQATSGVTPLATVCSCPETAATSDCPAVNTDIARPPYVSHGPSGWTMACSVTLDQPSLTLCVGQTRRVDAHYFQNGSAAIASWMWVPQETGIVAAERIEISPGANEMSANVTGVAPGSVNVRAYADGSFAELPVTVNLCAPP